MPHHTPGEDDSAPGTRQALKKGLGFPFGVARTQAMGNRGLAAASIGWTLAGCIIVGFTVGSWLDRRMGTQFWTPILLLVGAFAGFREMFRTVAQISQAPRQVVPSRPAGATNSPPSTAAKRAAIEGTNSEPQAPVARAGRQRLFTVPPPPFMEQPSATQPQLSAEEVKRRLSRGPEAVGGGVSGEETRDAV